MDSVGGCISPAWLFFPIFLVTWRLGVSVCLQYQVLFRLQFCFRGLGFYGLISGGVNCSDQEVAWGWCFPHWLAETRGRSFIPLSAGSPYWRVKALESVSNLQSSISLKCVLFYAMPLHFVVLFQGTSTGSLCCRAGGLAHPFFQLGSETAPASCHRVLQK